MGERPTPRHGSPAPAGGAGEPSSDLPEAIRGLPRVGDMYSHTDRSLGMFSVQFSGSFGGGRHSTPEQLARHLESIRDDLIQTLRGQYHQHEIVGVGGMGVVISASDRNINKVVAIKVSQFRKDSAEGLQFLEEAKRLVDLKEVRTPHVPEIYGYGVTDGGRPYFIMELVRGPTLLTLSQALFLDGQRPKQWRQGAAGEVLEHFADALEALDVVHSHGYIHRDLKPENLKLNLPLEFGRELREVVILDWGLFCRHDTGPSRVGTISVVGTPDYMSPEQARGDASALNPRSDVWSAGATLYRMLTGSPVVPGAGIEEKLEVLRSLGEQGAPLELSCPDIPPELAAVVRRALQPELSLRYQTAGEMAKDLRAFLERGVVSAYVERQSVRGMLGYYAQVAATQALLWLGRHKFLSVGAGAIVAGGSYGLFEYQQQVEVERVQAAESAQRESDVRALKIQVEERLESARISVAQGRLAEGVLALSRDLSVALRAYPELAKEAEQLERYREDWKQLLELQSRMVRAYSATVSSFDFSETFAWDSAELEGAAATFLPAGLSPAGLLALEERLARSSYTETQRRELGDTLLECCVLQFMTDFSDVLRSKGSSAGAQDDARAALQRLDLLEELARVCDGSAEPDPARQKIFSSLRAPMHRVLGDTDAWKRETDRARSTTDSRGATTFLSALIVPVPDGSADKDLRIQRLRASGTVFLTSSSLDQEHFGAAYFAAQRFRALLDLREGEPRHAIAQSLCAAMERCVAIERENPYLLAQLVEACHLFWAEDRLRLTENRVGEYALALGVETGGAVQSMIQIMDRALPADFYMRYGELCMDTPSFDRAARAFESALRISPSRSDVMVRLACARGAGGGVVDTALVDSYQANPEADPVEYLYAAAAYAYVLEQNPHLDSRYGDLPYELLERAIERVPALRSRIGRLRDIFFQSIKDDPRFLALTQG